MVGLVIGMLRDGIVVGGGRRGWGGAERSWKGRKLILSVRAHLPIIGVLEGCHEMTSKIHYMPF